MTAAVLTLLIASVLVLGAPRLLTRLTDPGFRPMLGVAAWQLTSWSVIVGIVISSAFVVRPDLERYVEFPVSLHSGVEVLGHVSEHRHALWLQALAAAVVVLMLARLTLCAAANGSATHRRRSRHRALLLLVARRHATLDAHVVAGEVPVVYCVPGRGGCVVFSSSAIARLSTEQRRAVLDHEHAHLRGHHHLLLASAALLSCAFPRIGLFAQARNQTTRLVEMRADDVAARRHGRRAVAEALLSLADVACPPGALAATGVTTADRIERLAAPTARRARGVAADAALLAGVVILSASPIALAVSGHAIICQL